jgi:C-terminal processing protease CtpA/Prc
MKIIIILSIIAGLLLPGGLVAQDKEITPEERIFSLSSIWKELHYSFAFPENLKEANIDSLYIDYLPKIIAAKNRFDYFRVLNAFMAHFNEPHTRIYTNQRPDDYPPLKVTNIGENIIVDAISQSLVEKVPLGSELLEVDNIPVMTFLKDSIYPYIAATTPHWKFEKAITEMLYGKPETVMNITYKTPKGKIQTIEMVRDYNTKETKDEFVTLDSSSTPPLDIQFLKNDIAYIRLSSCLWQYKNIVDSIFTSSLPRLRKTKGLIIDLRGNRGGSDEIWHNIAYHLIPESEFDTNGKWLSKKYIATYKMWGQYDLQLKDYLNGTAMQEIMHSPYISEINDSLKLHQPLLVISGKHVASAAEDFLLVLKETKRATIIGGPSVGCIGEPMLIPLLNDFGVMICAKKYINPDGSQPNLTGILPDIPVEQSYSAYLKGKDNVLEQAIKELNKIIAESVGI